MAYLTAGGLGPRVTSGWRDPDHQRALQARWDAGDRAGLRARPASDSLHTKTDWIGDPAARAVDIATSDDTRAAQIASALGIGAGLYFTHPDPGHFYDLNAR